MGYKQIMTSHNAVHDGVNDEIADGDEATQCERDCLDVEVPSAELKDEMSEDKTHEKEIGGPKGLEPTRYGDWEVNGRCSDF